MISALTHLLLFHGVFTMNSLFPEELIHEWSHLLSLAEEQ
jgi:hypothetical protein